jgi:hypothetical protein
MLSAASIVGSVVTVAAYFIMGEEFKTMRLGGGGAE